MITDKLNKKKQRLIVLEYADNINIIILGICLLECAPFLSSELATIWAHADLYALLSISSLGGLTISIHLI